MHGRLNVLHNLCEKMAGCRYLLSVRSRVKYIRQPTIVTLPRLRRVRTILHASGAINIDSSLHVGVLRRKDV